MKLGLIDIEKAYLGTRALDSSNAFLGIVPLINGSGPTPPTPVSYDGLKFTSTGSTSISLTSTGGNAPDMKYSLDGGSTWTLWDYSSISLSDGDIVCFKGNNPNGFAKSYSKYNTFASSGTGTIAASGNIMSLIDDGACTTTTIPNANCFYEAFRGCSRLTSAPDLPATTLQSFCYRYMFKLCTNLTKAPSILPATTLTKGCYNEMFYLTAITEAPELPALILVERCYSLMFTLTNTINYVKCLATDISAFDCVDGWLSSAGTTGTFVKNANMTSWTTGINGIPSGWTVQDA